MSEFFTSGNAVVFILAVVGVEGAWLAYLGRWDLVRMLVPGAILLLAVHAALTGGPWWQVAAWLTASLPAHLYDLYRRFPDGRQSLTGSSGKR
ncbi:hypothetical protein [Glacieibacterium sp.]|uniref:hypothetical protein n=1 Tax=Glacieibacterium sp. TaxID=2860237 RepID=UPI003AFF7497